jgi:hypothetical protein
VNRKPKTIEKKNDWGKTIIVIIIVVFVLLGLYVFNKTASNKNMPLQELQRK